MIPKVKGSSSDQGDRHRAPSDQRKFPRFRLEGLRSTRGSVVDLSREGACIVSSRRPFRGVRPLRLYSEHGLADVAVKVAWSRRLGICKHLIGVQFTDVSAETAHRIEQLIKVHVHAGRRAA